MPETSPAPPIPHAWNLSVDEAKLLQKRLADQVVREDRFETRSLKHLGGVDASYRDEGTAAISICRYPDMTLVSGATAIVRAEFPYVPGLLSFRETPLALAAWEKLTVRPDLLMLDGQGYAHPRRFGIACHIGLWLDLPTIGVAKSVLCGKFENLGEEAGDQADLVHKGEVIGRAVRTKKRTNPLIISAGHKISLDTAVELVLSSCRGYRLPEPTRLAHNLAGGLAALPEPDMAKRRVTIAQRQVQRLADQ